MKLFKEMTVSLPGLPGRDTQKCVTVRRPMPKTGNGTPNEAVIAHSPGVFRDTQKFGLGPRRVGLGNHKKKSPYLFQDYPVEVPRST